jgi:hypothetical protein
MTVRVVVYGCPAVRSCVRPCAVCARSARNSILAVRLVIYMAVPAALCDCPAVRQCAAVCLVVCGGSARDTVVRQCAAVCCSVRLCERLYAGARAPMYVRKCGAQ